ncbi:ribosomal protein L6 [Fragilariopsis cylindrus CCMP1102]|uniref:Ribosomal protein L6 n=1 Tax=Fragilariopsis cylindrus CCMP1102 TaxID=635003 RepID=A0A1E7FRK0_9STRA|nr:ribosomal protein L6 [Fragilariopsis cylindrus CCMP1102]|eukprot:OEU20744.1 ribosomal protein L6 [Fragilariopsis cylindrus CCMP1102]
MKIVLASRTVEIPDGVTVEVKARVVKVTGPLGTLERDFKHIPMECRTVTKMEGEEDEEVEKKYVQVDLWFATRKQLACVRTVCSHVENMIIGTTRGFLYKMRFVYSHFPINVSTSGENIEIRNFLGERRVRKVKLPEGVVYLRSEDTKDEIQLSGIDITQVSLTAAKIQQSTNVRHKDLRKFLDGIYVSEKGPTPE